MKKLFLVVMFLLVPTLLLAGKGPKQFTITNPDGTMTTGQYVPDTGQVIIQTREGFTIMQREPNNNIQVLSQPPAPEMEIPSIPATPAPQGTLSGSSVFDSTIFDE